ncbi:MAG TPA: Calx-beta domain-containing protein [Allosphingosinicella sp.]|nr:Calx-beta domain-containing protein [Allosphingosinicella sp.]
MTASTLALAGAAGASVTVSGGGFETPEVGAGYVYAPTGSPVTYTAHSGVAGNGSAWGFASAPEGDQVAFLQIGPSPPTISLAVSGLTAGTSYVATFRIVARPGYESLPLTVAFDGVPLGTFTPASTTFAAKVSAPFTAGSGSGTLTFTGGNYSVERSTGLDNVRVATAGNEIVTFSYDALGRLAGTSTAGGPNTGSTASAGYDAAGNRTVYAMSVSGAPAFSVSEAAAVEGGGLVFTVVKNGTGAASVSYATAGGTAGGGDFHGASGGLSFAAGESAKTVAVATVDDASDEPGETLSLNLSGPSAGSTVADGQGIGTIFDNDEPPPPPPPPPPSFSVGDASVTEGGILVFTVTKTGPAVQVFAVDFATAGGTATGTYSGNGDYYTGSARLYFQPAETSRTVSIHTIEDPMDEPNETVSLNLSNASGGASITDAQAIGTILDNDEQPAGNIPPTPQDDTGTQKACSLKTYYVLANDTDPDGHTPLTIIGSSHPSFTAGSNAIEVDSSNIASGEFTTYTVRDTAGATATARLTVYLTAGNCGSNQ